MNRTRDHLAEAINTATAKHDFHVWSYVFMPDHVHLLVWPAAERYSMSALLLSIKQPVARREIYYRKLHAPDTLDELRTGQRHAPFHFWQDGSGHDRHMVTDRDLDEVLTYIHSNPVKRGLVGLSAEWFWSSAGLWAGGEPGPVQVDRTYFPLLNS